MVDAVIKTPTTCTLQGGTLFSSHALRGTLYSAHALRRILFNPHALRGILFNPHALKGTELRQAFWSKALKVGANY
jgi:hypothetical protein